MRTKKISLLLALMLTISAIALPLTAYAAGDKDTTPPKIAASLNGDTLKVESSDDHSGVEAVFVDGNRINSLTNGAASVALKDYAGTEKQVSVYAQDYAGNRSETVKFDNPYYEEPEETKETSAVSAVQVQSSTVSVRLVQAQAASSGSTNTSAQSSNSGSTSASTQSGNSGNGSHAGADTGGNAASGTNENGNSANSQEETETASSIPEGAFTPEGTGTVQDSISGEDGEKQFYTITTEAGNVFYLVIDGKRDDNNVYFLNGVTEAGLMALAEKGDGSVSVIPAAEACTFTEKCEAGKVNTDCTVCKNDLNGCTGKEAQPTTPEEPDEPEEPEKDTGSTGTIIFVIVALLVVGGAGYYVKIVRPKQQAEDDEDFEEDGYGEGFDPDEAYGEPEYLSEEDFDDKDGE